MSRFGLFQIHPSDWKDTNIELHNLDRKKQRKKKDCDKIHKKYVAKFRKCMDEAKKAKGTQLRSYNRDAFNNYVRWFVDNSRVEIFPPAYEPEILEEPTVFDELGTIQYSRLIGDGRQTDFAPVLNFVCQGQKLRRISNLLGCRDPKIATPTRSRSKSPFDPVEHPHSTSANLEDEVSSGVHGEPDMTLGAYQEKVRSAYMLKPGKERYDRYTPNAYTRRANKAVVQSDDEAPQRSAMRRMRGDEEEDDDVEQEEEEPRPVAMKLRSKTGRGRGRNK